MSVIPLKYYKQEDALEVARFLIGKVLCSTLGGVKTEGVIYETEAYCGLSDRACHAYPEKRTERTAIFYEQGGIAYVYLCYGIHNLFNIVTGPPELPRAVLIRAAYPIKGLEEIKKRRKNAKHLADGPGKLTQAFGIKLEHNGFSLRKKNGLWVEDRGISLEHIATPRIGVDYAGEDANLPWRFLGQNLQVLENLRVI